MQWALDAVPALVCDFARTGKVWHKLYGKKCEFDFGSLVTGVVQDSFVDTSANQE